MKRTIFTIAAVALFSVVVNAQASEQAPKRQTNNERKVNADGTLAPSTADEPARAEKAEPSVRVSEQPAPDKMNEQKPATKSSPAPRKDRHAITEKGVPSSKAKAKPASEKRAEPVSEKK